jgi:uncharacterized protein YjbJ (UPF0337 family)
MLDEEATMDKKHVEGGLDELKGRVKETAGVATNDRELEGEGKLDQAKGKVKETLGNIRQGIKHALDSIDKKK